MVHSVYYCLTIFEYKLNPYAAVITAVAENFFRLAAAAAEKVYGYTGSADIKFYA